MKYSISKKSWTIVTNRTISCIKSTERTRSFSIRKKYNKLEIVNLKYIVLQHQSIFLWFPTTTNSANNDQLLILMPSSSWEYHKSKTIKTHNIHIGKSKNKWNHILQLKGQGPSLLFDDPLLSYSYQLFIINIDQEFYELLSSNF